MRLEYILAVAWRTR